MLRRYRFIFFSVALVLVFVGAAVSDIYRYIDENGVLHFTNVPTASSLSYRVFIREIPPSFPKSSPSHPYEDLIRTAARKNGIAASLLKAVIKAESNFNPRAVSKKGAMGLMQIMPATMKALEVGDPFDPKENIMGGARYLKDLIHRFDGKLPLAIAAYNAGPEAVKRYQNIPPYRETEAYVKRVLRYYHADKNS